MVGYSIDEVIDGKVLWSEMTPPEWRHLDIAALQQLKTIGVMEPVEKEYFHKNGSRIRVRVQGTNFEGSSEGIAYVQDITAQRKAEKDLAERDLELRSNQERLAMAISHARVGFYDWDVVENRIIFSDRMMRDWGLDEGHRIDTLESAMQLIHPEDRERVRGLINTAMLQKSTYEAEYRVVHPTGSMIWVEVHGSVIFDAKGKPIRFFGSSIDITKKKKQQEELKLAVAAFHNDRENFRTLFKQTPEMVCILRGPDHVFEFVNEAHIRALGFDATGMAVRVAQPESVEVHGILDGVYRTGKTAELREIPITLTDRLRYFNLTYSARRDEEGEIDGIMILGVEITDQVLAREALKKTELALKSAVRSRDEFLSIASHELKTPITSLKLQAQLALRRFQKAKPFTPEQISELMDMIERQANRLNRLVDDMLDIAHIRSGRLQIQRSRVRLDEFLAEAMLRFGPIFKQAETSISLSVEQSFEGDWDRVRLEQVLNNLLTNGLRYGNKKPISITLRRSPLQPSFARLEVRDEGRGISADALDRIFNRFERDVDRNEVSGLGLGLFITRQIVEAHGGKVWAESEGLQKGSTFIVELPISTG